MELYWKRREKEKNFEITLVIIFWNFAMFYYRSDSPQVKRNVISSIANLVYELPYELPPNEFSPLGGPWCPHKKKKRLKILKHAKTPKCKYQTFLALSSFTGFLYFTPNILSRIVWTNKVLVLTWPSLLQTWFFVILYIIKGFLQSLRKI